MAGFGRPCLPAGGEFPAYGADAVRWGLLAMSSGQDVKFAEDKVQQGQQLTNKLWNASRLILLGVGPDARAAVRPGDGRGPLDPLPPGAASGEGRGADRALRLLARRARALRLRLRRAVRLVPGAGQTAAARRRARAVRDAPARPHGDGRARAPAHPVRDRGDLELPPGRRGAARGGHRRAASAPIDEALRRRSLDVIAAVQALRGWRDYGRRQGRRDRAGAPGRPRLRADGGARRAARAARRSSSDATAASPVASVRDPGRRGRDSRRRRPRPRGAAERKARRSGGPNSRPRSSARSASSRTRASSPRRRLRSSRPSAPSWPGCAPSSRRSHECVEH